MKEKTTNARERDKQATTRDRDRLATPATAKAGREGQSAAELPAGVVSGGDGPAGPRGTGEAAQPRQEDQLPDGASNGVDRSQPSGLHTEGQAGQPLPLVSGFPTDAKLIHRALAAVMHDVQGVAKTGKNTHSNYNFRGIDAVLNAVGPALRKHGVVPLPEVQDMSTVQVETGRDRTLMNFVRLKVSYTFIGPLGDSLNVVVPGEAMDSGDKAVSKAMSVALRTALIQTLALPTDEPDPDENTYELAPPAPAAITPEQLRHAMALFNDLGITDRTKRLDIISAVVKHPVGSTSDLTMAEASRLIEALKLKQEQRTLEQYNHKPAPLYVVEPDTYPGDDDSKLMPMQLHRDLNTWIKELGLNDAEISDLMQRTIGKEQPVKRSEGLDVLQALADELNLRQAAKAADKE